MKIDAANIIYNCERLNAFTLRLGTKQGYPPSPIIFNIVLEGPASTIHKKTKEKNFPSVTRRYETSFFPQIKWLQQRKFNGYTKIKSMGWHKNKHSDQ